MLKIIRAAAVAAVVVISAATLMPGAASAAPAPGTPSGSFWTEVINRDSARCMNVAHGSQKLNEVIQQYHCDRTPAAKFLFRDMGEDNAVRQWYQIENQNSRYCVGPNPWGADPWSVDPIVQYGCTASPWKQWTIGWQGDGYYRIINRETGRCLSTRWERADWAQLVEESCRTADADQEWWFRLG